MREVRRIFPYTEMAIITNALLLLKDSAKYDALLTACQETGCASAISSYKPVYSRKAEIDKFLEQYGVKYYWQGWQIPKSNNHKGVVVALLLGIAMYAPSRA